jgi:hypothetical protein
MVMRADIKAGNAFPDYQLPDHTGRPRRLSEIQAGDPMIIVLAREAYWERGDTDRFYPPELGWPPGVAAGGTGTR